MTGGDKKRVEVNERKMTDEDRKLSRRAKEAELQSWLDGSQSLCRCAQQDADKDRAMRARWVLTWKSNGKAKVRPCVLGFQDPDDLKEVPRDSPTLSAQAQALILQCVASGEWKLVSGDIKTAFLAGYEELRNIFLLPPDDVRHRAVYVLVNTRRNGGIRLKRSLPNHGFTSCALDPCAFVRFKQKTNQRCA